MTRETAVFEHCGNGYSYSDILQSIKAVGICPGDSIFVHSDLKSFGKLAEAVSRDEFIGTFIRALIDAVGENGNVIMPTFSYSFCKKEVFDPENTPSTVGIMTEYFRKIPGVKRSSDAIFSVAAIGPDAGYFTSVGNVCFGEKSIFEKLYQRNAKMLFLGNTFDITYMHFVEQKHGVPYRYIKQFAGKMRQGDAIVDAAFDYNVRPLDKDIDYDLEKIASYFEQCGILSKSCLGNSKVRCVSSVDAFNSIITGLKKDAYFLLKNKSAMDSEENQISLLSPEDIASAGKEMYSLIKRLFPFCRSITGNGVRQTLEVIKEHIPVEVHEVPSGTPIFDWTVPKEWNLKDAYIKDSSGNKIIDAQKCNLHILNYSIPVRANLRLNELKQHIFTLPEHPDWIPYLTSYYKEQWGFCMTHRQLEQLKDGEYEVVVDSSLEDGSLTYGELFLPGKSDEEIIFSTYLCHPSVCNDNLSGVVLLTKIAGLLANKERKYSYRFLFIPETIGAITWLAQNEGKVSKIKAGLIATCVGDVGISTYKRSRIGNSLIDMIAEKVLADIGSPHRVIDFSPGSDERQFCSPGFNLPVGSLMRTPYSQYPEYHTSADNLDFVNQNSLADSLMKYLGIIYFLENNRTYVNLVPKCEPRLGKRGLYRAIGGQTETDGYLNELTLLWVLNLSDGKHSLLDIATRSKMNFKRVIWAAKALNEAGLLQESPGQQ